MSHVPRQLIHAFADRAIDVTVEVTTSEAPAGFSAITFESSDGTSVTGLTATATASGFDVDFTVPASGLATPGTHTWELKATLAGEVRTIGYGPLVVSPTP